MKSLLDRLLRDHNNFLAIHKVLKRKVDCLNPDSENSEIDLVLHLLQYLKTYPEQFHHPLEDRIYASLRAIAKSEDLIGILDDIESEHGKMSLLTKNLLISFNSIKNGKEKNYAKLKKLVNDYIYFAEEHIFSENKYLIPFIQSAFSKYDLELIALELKQGVDRDLIAKRQNICNELYQKIGIQMDSSQTI